MCMSCQFVVYPFYILHNTVAHSRQTATIGRRQLPTFGMNRYSLFRHESPVSGDFPQPVLTKAYSGQVAQVHGH